MQFPYENYFFLRLCVSAYQMPRMSFSFFFFLFFSRMGMLKHCSVLQACFNLHILTARINTRKENDKWVKLVGKGSVFRSWQLQAQANQVSYNIFTTDNIVGSIVAQISSFTKPGQNFEYKHKSTYTVSLHVMTWNWSYLCKL